MYSEEIDKGSSGEKGIQERVPNDIVPIDDAIDDPLLVLDRCIVAQEKNRLVEENA